MGWMNVRFPPFIKTAAGMAMNVRALVRVAVSDPETAHHGTALLPRKKPRRSPCLPRNRWPIYVVPINTAERVIQLSQPKEPKFSNIASFLGVSNVYILLHYLSFIRHGF
jgi:hypothetical protein